MTSTRLLVLCSFALGNLAAAAAEDQPPRILPEQAREHVGQKVEVVFEVQAAKHSLKRQTVYLDSQADFHDPQNLGIAISQQGIDELQQQRNIQEPAEFYRRKKIRVVGTVVIEDERAYIKVTAADQIHLADEKTEVSNPARSAPALQ